MRRQRAEPGESIGDVLFVPRSNSGTVGHLRGTLWLSRPLELAVHELAETAVDPLADFSNPEVCDGCFGNCKNRQFDLFDANGRFIGGTGDPSTASGFTFYINSLIQPEFIDPNSDED